MKKTLLSVLALFTFTLCNAQVKTQSNYDVDGNGKVTIEDGTSTVNKVLGKAADERTLVDGESLNAILQEILTQLNSLKEQIAELKNKNCSCNCSGEETTDPYNGHEYVDLGLHSGLKWATCNLGAENPEDYGYYYAWGATEPQDVYDYVHCPFQTQNVIYNSSTKFTKYLGSTSSSYKDPSATDANALKIALYPEDDAAHVNWGGNWRMPTKEEQEELRSYCKWTWGAQNGVSGYTVVGPNGNSLFLPAAGCHDGDLYNVGGWGGYWSSSLNSYHPYWAYCLYFNSRSVDRDWDYRERYYGLTVRAVCP